MNPAPQDWCIQNGACMAEYDDTGDIFTRPKDSRTEAYISGRIG